MDKSILQQKMIELETRELEQSLEDYQNYLSETRLMQTETILVDDQSQASAASELASAFNCSVQSHSEKIETLKSIDFGPKSNVEVGAVVRLGQKFFVVAVATKSFELDGETFMGISAHAPAFQSMQGLSEGDSCLVNGKTIEVGGVF